MPTDMWINHWRFMGKELATIWGSWMTSALNQQLLCAVEKLQSGEGNRVLASKGVGYSYLMMKYWDYTKISSCMISCLPSHLAMNLVHGPLQTILKHFKAQNKQKKEGWSNNEKGWGKNTRGQVPEIGGCPVPFVTLAKSLVKISVQYGQIYMYWNQKIIISYYCCHNIIYFYSILNWYFPCIRSICPFNYCEISQDTLTVHRPTKIDT